MGRLAGKAGAHEAHVARCQKALDLRISGARYRQIGAALGVSHNQAHRDVTEALDELAQANQAKAGQLRDIELERCEKLTIALWAKVKDGDAQAITAAVRVMERRARLLGLDAPTKTALTDPSGEAPFTSIHRVIIDRGEPADDSHD